jgi:hypothetical protein
LDLGQTVTILEANVSAYFLGNPQHRTVVPFADQMDPFYAVLVRYCQGTHHQRAANPSRTPLGFNGEGGLRFIAPDIAH